MLISTTVLPMQLPNVLQGQLHKRYKRFLADVSLGGSADGSTAMADAQADAQVPQDIHVVHCPNTGPMTGLLDWWVHWGVAWSP